MSQVMNNKVLSKTYMSQVMNNKVLSETYESSDE